MTYEIEDGVTCEIIEADDLDEAMARAREWVRESVEDGAAERQTASAYMWELDADGRRIGDYCIVLSLPPSSLHAIVGFAPLRRRQ